MNNNTITLNLRTSMLRTALQEAIDNIDMIRFIKRGDVDVPAYIKKAAELADDTLMLEQQTVSNLFESLDAIRAFTEDLNEKSEKAAEPHQDSQQAATSKEDKPVFTASVYLMPELVNLFDSEKSYCRQEEREGSRFCIRYRHEEVIIRCVVADPGDEKGSWNNDGVPAELASLLGSYRVMFPDYLPLSLVADIAGSPDGCDLDIGCAIIRLIPLKKQGIHYKQTAKEVLDEVKAYSARKYHDNAKTAEDWYNAGVIAQQCSTVEAANGCFHRAAERGSKLAEHKLGIA